MNPDPKPGQIIEVDNVIIEYDDPFSSDLYQRKKVDQVHAAAPVQNRVIIGQDPVDPGLDPGGDLGGNPELGPGGRPVGPVGPGVDPGVIGGDPGMIGGGDPMAGGLNP